MIHLHLFNVLTLVVVPLKVRIHLCDSSHLFYLCCQLFSITQNDKFLVRLSYDCMTSEKQSIRMVTSEL